MPRVESEGLGGIVPGNGAGLLHSIIVTTRHTKKLKADIITTTHEKVTDDWGRGCMVINIDARATTMAYSAIKRNGTTASEQAIMRPQSLRVWRDD